MHGQPIINKCFFNSFSAKLTINICSEAVFIYLLYQSLWFFSESNLVPIVLLETERCAASQEIPQIFWNLSGRIMGTRVHL
jgi:hypothetical protein